MSARVLAAGALLVDARTWLAGAGLLVRAGRIERVLSTPAAVRRAGRRWPVTDLGDMLLTPGLVNAHVHLELSGLAGRTSSGGPFGTWVERLLELRGARTARARAADARRGARRCLATASTLVGDVDTTGAAERGLADVAVRVRLFREVLDAQDPARTPAAVARAAAPAPRRARLRLGLAPHAPFSASPGLLAALGRLARRRRVPVSVHWSETEAEVRWLSDGEGPLAGMLGRSPRRAGLDLLQDAGLLGPRLTLVHGNHPQRGEIARLASAGATLVHCPGSHAWFARPPFDLVRYLRAGVPVALGTDSLASNEDLDLTRELAILRRAHPELAPERAWEMATSAGARALGHEGEAGLLAERAFADLVAWRGAPAARRAALEALTSGSCRVERVWVGGRAVAGASGT